MNRVEVNTRSAEEKPSPQWIVGNRVHGVPVHWANAHYIGHRITWPGWINSRGRNASGTKGRKSLSRFFGAP